MSFNNRMHKGILPLLFIFFGTVQLHSQVSFRPGLRAGANFSHFTKGSNYYDNSISGNLSGDYSSKTDFYLGFYGSLKLSKFYTLQPEINYSAQGSETNDNVDLNLDYLSFGILNKFTFGDKFNVHFGPTLDFVVDKNFDVDADVDMAFVLGAGINLTPNFGLEARIKKGIIPVIDSFNYDDGNHTNVVFSLGATYTFDVK